MKKIFIIGGSALLISLAMSLGTAFAATNSLWFFHKPSRPQL